MHIFASGNTAAEFDNSTESTPEFPDDATVRELFDGRFRSKRAGAIAALIDDDKTRIITVGDPTRHHLNNSTIFEIGSITKAFVGTILADMVLKTEVHLDDPVAMYLPEAVRVPRWHGRDITLQHLATHTSALPRIPSNMRRFFTRDPYRNYSVERLYQFLGTHSLRYDPGSSYEYSNLGVGLLGHALARRAGMSFEDLVTTRIAAPLGMSSTRITLTHDMSLRFAGGHNRLGLPTPHWNMACLAAAGGLRSSMDDMTKFLAAAMLLKSNGEQLYKPMLVATTARIGSEAVRVGLCWHTLHRGEAEIVWHNGATGGFSSFLAFNRAARRGIVILSNARARIDAVGMRLLDPSARASDRFLLAA